MLDAVIKFLQALTPFLDKLSVSKTLMLGLLTFFGVILKFVYDNRQALFTQVIDSPILSVAGGSALIVLVLGWIFNTLVARADERNEAYCDSLVERIHDLSKQLEESVAREAVANDRFATLVGTVKMRKVERNDAT